MLTVYLTNTEIQAVSGSMMGKKYRINKIWRGELPPDAYRNGEITDAALLKEAVSAFWKENKLPKTANLVIHGSRFVLKTIDAPQLRMRQLRAFIAREYSDLDRSSQPVFTSFALSSDAKRRQMRLLAAVAERPYLLKIMDVFQNAGVKIGAADSSLGCSIRALSCLPEVKKKTCIVQLLESGTLTSLLFVNGEYAYSTSNRMTASPDTFEFGIGVARIVSSILQFCKAQYADDAVTDVFLGGFSGDSTEVCIESIAQMDPTLEVAALSGGSAVSGTGSETFHALVPVVGGLSMPQNIQLLKELHSREEKNKSTQDVVKMLIPAAAALLIFGSVAGVLLVKHAKLEHELEALNDQLMNPQYVAAGKEYDNYQKEIAALDKMIADAQTTIRYIESYPLPTSEVVAMLYRCADGLASIYITGYDASSGVFSLSTSSEDVAVVNQYIERLRKEESFSDVRYTGYSYNERTESWNVQVVCTLAAEAGR